MGTIEPTGMRPLLDLLEVTTRSLGEVFLAHMAAAGHDHGLAHARVMGRVPAEGIRLTALAEQLGITKQAAGELVDDLEAEGYLQRRPDPTDRRAKLVVFGPRGHAAVPDAWAALDAVEQHVREIIGPAALTRLRAALELLAP